MTKNSLTVFLNLNLSSQPPICLNKKNSQMIFKLNMTIPVQDVELQKFKL